MRRVLAAMTLSMMAMARPAAAADLVSLFKTLCWDHSASFSAALNQSQAMGWIALPRLITDAAPDFIKTSPDFDGRLTGTRDGFQYIWVWKQAPGSQFLDVPQEERVCLIGTDGVTPAAAQTIKAGLQEWIGTSRGGPTNSVIFYFTDDADGRHFVGGPASPDGAQALASGRLKVIGFGSNDSAIFIMLALPAKAGAAL